MIEFRAERIFAYTFLYLFLYPYLGSTIDYRIGLRCTKLKYGRKVHHIADSSVESTVRCQRTSASCRRRGLICVCMRAHERACVTCVYVCVLTCLYVHKLSALCSPELPVLVGPCFMTYIKQGR